MSSYLDRIEQIDVTDGPYELGVGSEWHVASMHDIENVGHGDKPVTGYVSMSGTGPRGGYYGGPTFYTRERVDAFITALQQARDRAFPQND